MNELWHITEQILRLDPAGFQDFSPLAIFFIIFFATFVTEDGACLAAGALAGQGRIGLAMAVGASFAGIFVGDMGLYWLGRIFGRPLSETALFRRFVSERRLDRAALWLERRGARAVFLSRFVSGLRLPTYLAAGFLRTGFPRFALYFLLAAAVWTPLLVGSAAFAIGALAPIYVLPAVLVCVLFLKLLFDLTNHRRRRLLAGRLKRVRNWEFWPLWLFYLPVVGYVLLLALRHRGLTVFTCANPAIPAGGFVGESKDAIYRGLARSEAAREHLPRHVLLAGESPENERLARAFDFIGTNGLDWPLVLKPDAGERGRDVRIVRDAEELTELLRTADGADLILQEHAGGPEEASVFYYRYPSRSKGRIFSITEKRFPTVTGDGESTLEELILEDPRAVALAGKYFEQNAGRLGRVPARGEEVRLIEIGTHSRGAVFLDGDHLLTPALEERIEEICRGYEGFYFGRFDIRCGSFEELREGRAFRIVELNGVTSESTNVYDPRYTLLEAWRILFRQWRIAFEIGRENMERGFKPTSVAGLLRLLTGRRPEETAVRNIKPCA